MSAIMMSPRPRGSEKDVGATGLTPGMKSLTAKDGAPPLEDEGRVWGESLEALEEMRELAREGLRAREGESCVFYAERALGLALSLRERLRGEEGSSVLEGGGGGADEEETTTSGLAASCSGKSIARDALLLATAYRDSGEHLRAFHVLEKHGMLTLKDEVSAQACCLASRCLLDGGKRTGCLALLDGLFGEGDDGLERIRDLAKSFAGSSSLSQSLSLSLPLPSTPRGRINPLASLCALRGAVLAASDLSERSLVWLKAALSIDCRCAHALEIIVKNHLLSEAEQEALLDGLGLAADSKRRWLSLVYRSELKGRAAAASHGDRRAAFDELAKLGFGRSISTLVAKAEYFYERNDPQAAFQLCSAVQNTDPHATNCLPVYIACMVALDMKSQLFLVAHSLVESSPQSAITWHAVGAYYLLIEKPGVAQVNFIKAVNSDPKFLPAYIGLGNAYSAADQTPYAESAYRTAMRVFGGSHVPYLYFAMECLTQQTPGLADLFLKEAIKMAPGDALVRNEVGVSTYYKGLYTEAAGHFLAVLDLVKDLALPMLVHWTATYVNLGHCYRKMGEYSKAIYYFERANALEGSDVHACAALGLTLHMKGDYDAAIEAYHKTLSLQPNDSLVTELLDRALEDALGTYVSILDSEAVRSEATQHGASILRAPETARKSSPPTPFSARRDGMMNTPLFSQQSTLLRTRGVSVSSNDIEVDESFDISLNSDM